MLIESALDLFPFEKLEVETPVGRIYEGLRFSSKICGVSVIRAGESMESVLREVCGPIRIGKILIQRNRVSKLPHLFFSNLPADIAQRQVLLLEPMLATAGSALAAIEVLIEKGVREENIVLVNFITAPEGISAVCKKFPKLKMVTSSIEERLNENAYMLPGIGDFGDRFFGSDSLTVAWNNPGVKAQ
jgi:uracil phosphoribosyltransferase